MTWAPWLVVLCFTQKEEGLGPKGLPSPARFPAPAAGFRSSPVPRQPWSANRYSTFKWQGKISSMRVLAQEKSAGIPTTPGKETTTRRGSPVSSHLGGDAAAPDRVVHGRQGEAVPCRSAAGPPPSGAAPPGTLPSPPAPAGPAGLSGPRLRRWTGSSPAEFGPAPGPPCPGPPPRFGAPPTERSLPTVDPQGGQQISQILSMVHRSSSTDSSPSTGSWFSPTVTSFTGPRI